MKQMILIILFLLIARVLLAPSSRTLLIEKAKAIDPYKKITEAISWVESRHNDLAVNWSEYSYGRYQIRAVKLQDYFNRTGIRFTLEDMFDPAKSEQVLRYYLVKEGYQNLDRICVSWNGRWSDKSKTREYYLKVKNQINKN